MKLVLEEIDDRIARLIPDNGTAPYYLTVDDLPKDYQIGDVLNLSYLKTETSTLRKIEKVANEKEKRLKEMKAKREALLIKKIK
ncbi:DUF3006 family protein [Carnobacterium gallinarum]|uniref:DUF3006 family protein n=1 Tax=Carnobacterium gallinarum TaxID=2749 RepID=UPI000551DC20|nr:DUF3006 family protein [Carnobacterium gallinarum]